MQDVDREGVYLSGQRTHGNSLVLLLNFVVTLKLFFKKKKKLLF